jgi:sulfate permease, SulP family
MSLLTLLTLILEEVGRQQQRLDQKLLSNLLAGLTVGLVSLTYSVSFAALIFSGSLSAYFPQGVGGALMSAAIVGTIVALRSSFPFAIAGPDSNATAILAMMATAIAQEIQPSDRAERLFPTVWMAIALGTLLSGLLLYGMGCLNLGRWARFIPYPVMGGFLAGTGLLITRSSFAVMVDLPLEWSELPRLFQVSTLMHWLPGLLFAGVSSCVTHFYPQPLVLPAMLLGTIVGFNLLWHSIAVFVPLNPQGWFLEPFASDRLWHSWTAESITQVDWQVLANQSGTLIVLMVVVVITLLLNITGVELVTQQNSTLDKELRINGVANLVTALYGGMGGNFTLNRTLLHRSAGANSRIAGVTAAAFSGGLLLFGSVLMAYVPVWVLGGVLLTIGIKLLHEWLYCAWFKFPHIDYALILVILASITIWGFITGVGIGVVVACALFIVSYSRHQAVRHTFTGATHLSHVCRSFPEQRLLRQDGERIHILLLQGYLFFGTANTLLEQISGRLLEAVMPQIQFVVLDFRLVSGLDSSAVLSFIKLRQLLHKHGIRLVFTHLHSKILQQLQQGGCILPQDDLIQFFDRLDRGIEWCEDRMLETQSLRRPRVLPLALQLHEVFGEATDREQRVASFMGYLQKTQVPSDGQLFCAGDSSDRLYLIESGQVSEIGQLRNGKVRRLRTLGAGTILGEDSFYLGTPHQTAASTDRPSTLYCLSKANLKTMREEHPQIATAFEDFIIRLLAERLKYAYTEIEELL